MREFPKLEQSTSNQGVYDFSLFLCVPGFDHPLMVCCGTGGKYNFNGIRCGNSFVVNGTETTVGACKDPSARINWDGVHYTEAANEWIFKQIVDGAFSDPPIPLGKACQKEAHPSTN